MPAAGGLVYVGTYTGTFLAMKQKGGGVGWSFKTGGPIFSPPTLA